MAEFEPLRTTNEIFGYRKIEWTISNYFAGTCGNEWCIPSPEFCVYSPFLTIWRIRLMPSRRDPRYISIYFERLRRGPIPETVVVNWKFLLPDGRQCEGVSTFEPGKVRKIRIRKFAQLELRTLRDSCSNLTVGCHLIVYRKDHRNLFNFYAEGCFKSLSQDMLLLVTSGKYADTELYTGSIETIQVHRAILSCRNRVFKDMIPAGRRVVDFIYPFAETGAGRKLIGFLYTGNLKHVMRTPSLSIANAIDHFKVEELKTYYACDELKLETDFPVRELQLNWSVATRGEGPIATDPVRGLTDDQVVRLVVHPRGIDEADVFIALQFELLEVGQPREFCLYYGIVDVNNEIQNLGCSRWVPADGNSITIPAFVSRNILNDPNYVSWGILKLSLKMQRTDGAVCKEVSETHPAVVRVDKYKHYVTFSQQMASLIDVGKYGDVIIVSRVLRLRAHKVILSSRSHVLACILKDRSTLYFRKMEPHILIKILRYMYTGSIPTDSFDNIVKYYYYADELGILRLKNDCSRMLQANMQVRNVILILIKADHCRDWGLKSAALQFIHANLDEVRNLENWTILQERYPALYYDFAAFVDGRTEAAD